MQPPPDEERPYTIDFAEMIGGRRGVVDASLPGICLVLVDAFASLTWAIIAALVASAVLGVVRLIRHEPLRQAGMGLRGLAGAAALAAYTGDAKNYFLPGILANAGYALACIVSILVGRPLLAY